MNNVYETMQSLGAPEELLACITTRGKRKGLLLKNQPAGPRGMAWLAFMQSINPMAVTVTSLIMANQEEREVNKRVDEWLSKDCNLIFSWALLTMPFEREVDWSSRCNRKKAIDLADKRAQEAKQ